MISCPTRVHVCRCSKYQQTFRATDGRVLICHNPLTQGLLDRDDEYFAISHDGQSADIGIKNKVAMTELQKTIVEPPKFFVTHMPAVGTA